MRDKDFIKGVVLTFACPFLTSHTVWADDEDLQKKTPAEHSLDDDQPNPIVVGAWQQALDKEISRLNPATDGRQIIELGAIKLKVEKEAQKSEPVNHRELKDSLQQLRDTNPEIYDRVIRMVNKDAY